MSANKSSPIRLDLLGFRVSPVEMELLDEAAWRSRVTRSEFIRSAALGAASKVVSSTTVLVRERRGRAEGT